MRKPPKKAFLNNANKGWSQRRAKKQKSPVAVTVGALVFVVIACCIGFANDSTSKSGGEASNASAKSNPNSAVVAVNNGVEANGTSNALNDPLLVLVNSDNPLPSDWQVTPALIDDETVDIRIYDDLSAMLKAAAEDNIWFWVASGYRSVEQQENILSRAVEANIANGMSEADAEAEALRTIQKPGCSEHHTGLAIDFNDVSDDFEHTEGYYWLCEHAADYGFVQRYKSDKISITGIDNESWHYRYVGKEHARKMNELDMCLEEYIEYLKSENE